MVVVVFDATCRKWFIEGVAASYGCSLLQKGCFEPASRAVSSGLGSLEPVKQRTAYIDKGSSGTPTFRMGIMPHTNIFLNCNSHQLGTFVMTAYRNETTNGISTMV